MRVIPLPSAEQTDVPSDGIRERRGGGHERPKSVRGRSGSARAPAAVTQRITPTTETGHQGLAPFRGRGRRRPRRVVLALCGCMPRTSFATTVGTSPCSHMSSKRLCVRNSNSGTRCRRWGGRSPWPCPGGRRYRQAFHACRSRCPTMKAQRWRVRAAASRWPETPARTSASRSRAAAA